MGNRGGVGVDGGEVGVSDIGAVLRDSVSTRGEQKDTANPESVAL